MVGKALTHAAILKLKANDQRQEIPDAGAAGLRIVIQPAPSGAKSWAMRFRRPNGRSGKLPLGPFDVSGREDDAAPAIGQPLTVAAAHVLAADINRQRAKGVDVIAVHRIGRQQRSMNLQQSGAATFPANARDFIDRHARPKTRRWRETARMLGYNFPLDGDDQPTIIKGSICDRWRDRPLSEIDGDDIYAVVDEAQHHGVPGLGRKGKGASDARGRKMADVLGTLFGWLKKHRRVKADPSIGVHRPGPPPKGQRALNVRLDVRNADELRWFWSACDTMGYPFGDLCKVLLLTGCRREEIARMSRDAELSDDYAMLRLSGERTKNGLPHDVPLPLIAREILRNCPRIDGCDFVFSTNGKSAVSGFSKYKRRLDELMLAEAKAERGATATIPHWKLHDLRRTTSTGMAGIGIAPHVVEACLNHISGAKAGVAGVYNTELYAPEKRKAYDHWASHLADIISSKGNNVILLRR